MLFTLKQEVDQLKDVLVKAGLANPSGASANPIPALPHELPEIQDDVIGYEPPKEAPEEQDFEETEEELLTLKSLGKELIEKALKKHNGNRKAAAAELGISERTLYRKLKK